MNKKIVSITLSLLMCIPYAPVRGYAISHNSDSELKEVTIFVFTSEKQFQKMLKNEGVSADVLKKISTMMPKIATGGSLIATATGNPELVPLIGAIGTGLGAAAKYAVGPARWIMEQRYNAAIHKHTHRGNMGKDAEWNWKDIEKDYKIDPSDPFGLFVVFLNPETKEVLLMTPMHSDAAFGFTVERDPMTGKLIGKQTLFERNLGKTAEKDPSALARLFAYVKNRYENPHKIAWDIKETLGDMQQKFVSFSNRYPKSTDKIEFLSDQLDELGKKLKEVDLSTAKEQAQELVNFFKKELDGLKRIAQDPESQDLLARVGKKFMLFAEAINESAIKPATQYKTEKSELDKFYKERVEQELEDFRTPAEEDIAPIKDKGLMEGLL